MIDFHTHTFLSDGELGLAELVRRVEIRGFRAVALADHVDNGTLEVTLPILVRAARELSDVMEMKVLAGCELTHCRLEHIADLVARARQLGAQVVICHGESPVEPVLPGTNRTAIEAGVDILAHPGPITDQEALAAAEGGVLLEISGRRGHSLANGHVAATARRVGAKVIFGSDAHLVGDLRDRAAAEQVLRGAGLSDDEVAAAFENAERLAGLKV
ncbi:MAG: histidinol phosphate phosphatase domain-containing protein [Anaerolineaceae bacterium]|nr:histidinol phosphate phosphatase domain-containing protein [Anaerolineaceae bacterium]